MRNISLLALASFVLLLSSCGKPTIDLTAFQMTPQDTQTVDIPKDCSHLYDAKTWTVAVLEFNNNTGYGNSVVGGSSTTGKGASRTRTDSAAAVIGGRNAAIGVGKSVSKTVSAYSEDSSTFLTEFAPSLSTFAQSVAEETLVSMGGINIINRSHIENIMKEQKFQSAMADTNTIMEFGKLSGVKFIVTGAIDNIETKYVAPTAMGGNDNAISMLMSIVSTGVDAAMQGWYVTVTFSLNLIDAETGKILFAKKFKDSGRATQSSGFQPDLVINAAKGLFSSAVLKARNELTEIFQVKGYINEMRGSKEIAKINIGKAKGVKEGDGFDLFLVYTSTDFMTKKVNCSLTKTGARLVIADHVSETESWGIISGKAKHIEGVKIGTLAVRTSLGGK